MNRTERAWRPRPETKPASARDLALPRNRGAGTARRRSAAGCRRRPAPILAFAGHIHPRRRRGRRASDSKTYQGNLAPAWDQVISNAVAIADAPDQFHEPPASEHDRRTNAKERL